MGIITLIITALILYIADLEVIKYSQDFWLKKAGICICIIIYGLIEYAKGRKSK